MNCDEIRKKLKPFLDDLLTEFEFKEFCRHLDGCQDCCGYVRSFGSLSNQIWKLGKVRVPSDLASTVLFKVKTLKALKKHKRFSKKQLLGACGAILLLVLACWAAYYYGRKHSQPQESTQLPFLSLEPEKQEVKEEMKEEAKQEYLPDAPGKKNEPIVIKIEAPEDGGLTGEGINERLQ